MFRRNVRKDSSRDEDNNHQNEQRKRTKLHSDSMHEPRRDLFQEIKKFKNDNNIVDFNVLFSIQLNVETLFDILLNIENALIKVKVTSKRDSVTSEKLYHDTLRSELCLYRYFIIDLLKVFIKEKIDKQMDPMFGHVTRTMLEAEQLGDKTIKTYLYNIKEVLKKFIQEFNFDNMIINKILSAEFYLLFHMRFKELPEFIARKINGISTLDEAIHHCESGLILLSNPKTSIANKKQFTDHAEEVLKNLKALNSKKEAKRLSSTAEVLASPKIKLASSYVDKIPDDSEFHVNTPTASPSHDWNEESTSDWSEIEVVTPKFSTNSDFDTELPSDNYAEELFKSLFNILEEYRSENTLSGLAMTLDRLITAYKTNMKKYNIDSDQNVIKLEETVNFISSYIELDRTNFQYRSQFEEVSREMDANLFAILFKHYQNAIRGFVENAQSYLIILTKDDLRDSLNPKVSDKLSPRTILS